MRHVVPALLLLALAGPAQAQVLGEDAAACTTGVPAILVSVIGLKDRKGELKLELYPGTEEDFLKDDRDLLREGKLFRRVRVPTPLQGDMQMCVRVPRPGRYALLLTHNRDGKNKFSFWSDGAGFVSPKKIGRSRPKLTQALVDVPMGVRSVTIQPQYLRGLSGFGPVKN
ncbi:DUF2141 domain-containing protein [Sphingomonas bacterium]|uniref:DUF2141 domain-containing protein n=1 Tax=Sphingomonas bacterium TaxID=1895847 RepID=UPI002605B313|nr:DUF2141 domain-containing protein [Sphingomonas bacterium]